jgi:hypothetical protein
MRGQEQAVVLAMASLTLWLQRVTCRPRRAVWMMNVACAPERGGAISSAGPIAAPECCCIMRESGACRRARGGLAAVLHNSLAALHVNVPAVQPPPACLPPPATRVGGPLCRHSLRHCAGRPFGTRRGQFAAPNRRVLARGRQLPAHALVPHAFRTPHKTLLCVWRARTTVTRPHPPRTRGQLPLAYAGVSPTTTLCASLRT